MPPSLSSSSQHQKRKDCLLRRRRRLRLSSRPKGLRRSSPPANGAASREERPPKAKDDDGRTDGEEGTRARERKWGEVFKVERERGREWSHLPPDPDDQFGVEANISILRPRIYYLYSPLQMSCRRELSRCHLSVVPGVCSEKVEIRST